jgi:flagellar motility protein MotE (MotC chaperone)
MIEKARMSGALKNEGLTKRLLQCENDFAQLTEDYKSLLAKNKQLKKDYDDYKDHVTNPNQPSNRPPPNRPQ